MATPAIRVSPDKLEWTAIAGERQCQKLTLSNISDRDVCYKIKTTCVARFAVLPGQALIVAGGSAEVEIVLIKMDSLPPEDSLRDRFLIQAAFKEDPAEDVTAFWKRPHPRGELYQKKFSSELFLPDESEAQKEEERHLAEKEIEQETTDHMADEIAAQEEKTRLAEEEDAAAREAKRKADAQREAEQALKSAEAAAQKAEKEKRQRALDEDRAAAAAEAEAAAAAAVAAQAAVEAAAKRTAAASAPKPVEPKAVPRSQSARRRSSVSSMRLYLPDMGALKADPVQGLAEYAAPMADGVKASPLAPLLAAATDATQMPEGLLVLCASALLLLILVLIIGLSSAVTMIGFFPTALLSLRMLDEVDRDVATAMPLYWLVFTLLLLLESIGLTAWVPMYVFVKAGLLLYLWGFSGAEILFEFVPRLSK